MAYQNRQTIKKPFKIKGFFIINGGVDGTRTRDPRRDRPGF